MQHQKPRDLAGEMREQVAFARQLLAERLQRATKTMIHGHMAVWDTINNTAMRHPDHHAWARGHLRH